MTSFRITAPVDNVYSFRTHFLRLLLACKPQQWLHTMSCMNIDVFKYKMVFLPFEAEQQKSVFIVIGPGNVRCYDKRTFKGDRPCIIHFNPSHCSESEHNSHFVAAKIRAWLNHLWRQREDNGDNLMAPFHKRSLPVYMPPGNDFVCIVVNCRQCNFSQNRQLALFQCKNNIIHTIVESMC